MLTQKKKQTKKLLGSIDVNQLAGRSGQIIYLICQDDVEMRVEKKKNWTGNDKEGLSYVFLQNNLEVICFFQRVKA